MNWQLTAMACAIGSLTACGGGSSSRLATAPSITAFTADKPAYFVGDRAYLSASYANGTGFIEPGHVPIASGATIMTPILMANTAFRLVVTGESQSEERELAVSVQYRGQMRPLAMSFSRSEHSAVALEDGRVLIIGGEDTGVVMPATNYIFNPGTETFAPFGELASGRVGHIAVLLEDGDVLVAGGNRALSQAPLAEVLEKTTGTSTATANQPTRRRTLAAAARLTDGRVLIVGGFSGGMSDASAELYDPVTRTFSLMTARLNVARYGHTANVLPDGRVLIYGGFTEGGVSPGPELFDVSISKFTPLPAPERVTRGYHTAVNSLADGSVWIIGGEDDGLRPSGTTLRFSPTLGTFTHEDDLAIERSMLAAAPLTDGSLLVNGGLSDLAGADVTASSELVAGSTSRSDGPPMHAARFMHTATRLANGKVLVVGGLDTSRVPLASAEIFE